MKYIDAEKLIHDLEERIFAYSEGYAEGDDCRKDAIETLLKDVRYQCSLQQEQPKGDLDADIKMEWDSFNKHIAKYSEGAEVVVWLNWFSFVDIANYFYKFGLNARNEEKK